jgi:hypothetical protein
MVERGSAVGLDRRPGLTRIRVVRGRGRALRDGGFLPCGGRRNDVGKCRAWLFPKFDPTGPETQRCLASK